MPDRPPTLPGAVSRPRASSWIFGGLVLLGLVGALVTYKASGSLATLAKASEARTLTARPEAVPTGALPGAVRPLVRTFNYLAVVWPALAFGVLIGAAVRALVPSSWLAELVGGSPLRSQILGGLAGAPLMLCSCCVAPVFAAVHERTRRAGPASALLLAAPALNPAALALTFLLFAPDIAFARAALSVLLVFGVSAWAARFAGAPSASPAACPVEATPETGISDAIRAFGREAAGLARGTLPLIALGVLASALLVELVPVETWSRGPAGGLVVLAVALLSVPLALPTFAEIPLALGMLAAGAPSGAALALLVAGPAINLPSLLTLKRMTNAGYALALAAGTFVLAALGGLFV